MTRISGIEGDSIVRDQVSTHHSSSKIKDHRHVDRSGQIYDEYTVTDCCHRYCCQCETLYRVQGHLITGPGRIRGLMGSS